MVFNFLLFLTTENLTNLLIYKKIIRVALNFFLSALLMSIGNQVNRFYLSIRKRHESNALIAATNRSNCKLNHKH